MLVFKSKKYEEAVVYYGHSENIDTFARLLNRVQLKLLFNLTDTKRQRAWYVYNVMVKLLFSKYF